MKVATIITRKLLPSARVLAESYSMHHPGKNICVLLLDDIDGSLDLSGEKFDLIRPSDDLRSRRNH